VAPQCPTTDNWGNPLNILPTPTETLTVQLMQMLVASLPVDPTHVSVTGLSMGGIGTWDMINRYPALFAAAAPVAGAGYYTEIPDLIHVPIIAVHGTADTVISPLFDALMYQVIHMYGGAMIYFLITDAGHDVWDDIYPLTSFWQWMYTQKHI
jgi:predicted peptidase